MRQKGFTPILILVAFLIVAGIAFVAGQSLKSSTQVPLETSTPLASIKPSPTPAWTTYNNTLYKYSISFPSEFSPINLAAHSGHSLASAEDRHLYLEKYGDAEPYLTRLLEIQYIGMGSPTDIRTETQIAGLKASKLIPRMDNPPFDVYQIPIPDTDQYIEILVNKNDYDKQLVDQVLSTFKFTQ